MSFSTKTPSQRLHEKIVEAIGTIYCQPDAQVIELIQKYTREETDPRAKDILNDIVANSRYALEDGIPCCQDTGSVVLFVEKGHGFELQNGDITRIIEDSLEEAWQQFWLRRSIVEEPLFGRKIFTGRVPAIIHYDLIEGDALKISLGFKGGGAENMATLKMMPSTSRAEDVKEAVIEHVVSCGGKPCPPVIVGVGIGGNFEQSAIMAKRALFEPLGRSHEHEAYAKLERDILAGINQRGKGVMGLGAGPTALAVHIKIAPCHIASLPLAINLDCHSHRHTSFVIVNGEG